MPRRTRRTRRARRGMTIALLVVASITIITLDYRGQAHGVISWAKRGAHDAFSPVQHAVDDVVRPVGSFLSGAVHAGDLENQNAKLRRQLGALQRQALSRQALQNAVRSLDRLDALPWTGGIPTVVAQVTALSPSDFTATVELDKGSRQGVAVGMPVVGGAGLVGQVIEVWSSGCTVRLVTDVRSSVGVRFGPGDDLALVQGSGLGRDLAVNLVAPGVPLHTGEVLTTSGLQHAQFPPDIPVARVRSVSSTPSATQETVTAQPLADLDVLTYVDVLQWQSGS
ncbi:MAG TPA: rod shape-determining protein MreC [Acidimicrobiales bacterium]|nr:rod shape-determining protein MreC [Acidimicrobiales bacterium]